MSAQPKPLMELVREWPHELWGWDEKLKDYRCFPEFATSLKYCKRCAVEAALKAWAEHLEATSSPAEGYKAVPLSFVRERVLGVESEGKT